MMTELLIDLVQERYPATKTCISPAKSWRDIEIIYFNNRRKRRVIWVYQDHYRLSTDLSRYGIYWNEVYFTDSLLFEKLVSWFCGFDMPGRQTSVFRPG